MGLFNRRDNGPSLFAFDGTPLPVREGPSLESLVMSNSIDVVEYGTDVILVQERPSIKAADPDITDMQMDVELGRTRSAYSTMYREEYNAELRGIQGLIKYDRMRRSDASVRSALRTLKTPILGATWYVQPFDDTAQAREIAKFIQRNFMQYMTYSWVHVLWEALLMLDFGYFMHEKVYTFKEIDGVNRVVFQKLSGRHPLDVVEWHYDAHGGPNSVDLYNNPAAEDGVNIPINKLAVFTFDGEAGDFQGISVLRSAYKHWYYKENLYKIDAIQKERHGIGIPIIRLPGGFNPEDKKLAHEIGRNLRTNEKAHVVLPPNWEIEFAKIQGQPVSALESAQHHTEMIYQNILAQAIYANAEGDAIAALELFYKSTRFIADIVRNVVNKYCIPYLVMANWGIEDFPELKVRRLGDTQEARTITFALRNLVGAGIVQVDDDLEEWSRELIDAPRHDPNTKRDAPAPQMPGAAKPARQSQAKNGSPAGAANAGTDQSGGT